MHIRKRNHEKPNSHGYENHVQHCRSPDTSFGVRLTQILLLQIHEMGTEHHDRDSNDEKNQAECVQKWMNVVVQQPVSGKNKSERKRDYGNCKTRTGR